MEDKDLTEEIVKEYKALLRKKAVKDMALAIVLLCLIAIGYVGLGVNYGYQLPLFLFLLQMGWNVEKYLNKVK